MASQGGKASAPVSQPITKDSPANAGAGKVVFGYAGTPKGGSGKGAK